MRERRSTWRGHDRREPPRPLHGDTRPCADCGGVMVFHDEALLLHGGRPEPGWVCRDRHCNAREFVRRQSQ
jgi:hypothetical protein